nr:hypothetical protein GCM10020063_047520 [Dactylosporangium thailandense]
MSVAAVGLALAGGGAAALANFVPWPVAVVLGAGSAAAALGAAAVVRRGEAARGRQGALGDGTDSAYDVDGPLNALDPRLEVVRFNQARHRELTGLRAWALGETDGPAVWLLAGEPGAGKTRLAVQLAGELAERGVAASWARPERGAAAAGLVGERTAPSLLIVDDADLAPDLADVLTAFLREPAGKARLLLVARDFGGWWLRLCASLPSGVAAAVPIVAPAPLGPLTASPAVQGQLFRQALRAYSVWWELDPPAATLAPTGEPVPVGLVHAAAAVRAWESQDGPIELGAALEALFAAEEERWHDDERAAAIRPYGRAAVRAAVVAAVVAGAPDDDGAVDMLGRIDDLAGLDDITLRRIALWLRSLYPQQPPDWLSPRLPMYLVERYVAFALTRQPTLAATLARAVPESREARMVTALARAARHSAASATALREALLVRPALLRGAIAAVRAAAGPVDAVVAEVVAELPPTAETLAVLPVVTPLDIRHAPRTALAVTLHRLAAATGDPGPLLETLGTVLLAVADDEAGYAATVDAAALVRGFVAGGHPGLATPLGLMLTALARQLAAAGRPAEALIAAEDSVALLTAAAGSQGWVQAMTTRAMVLHNSGRYEPAVQCAAEAVEGAAGPAARARALVHHGGRLVLHGQEIRAYRAYSGGAEDLPMFADPTADGRRELDEAIELLEAGGPGGSDHETLLADALMLRAVAGAMDDNERAIELLRGWDAAGGSRYELRLAAALTNSIADLIVRNRGDEAVARAREAVQIVRRLAQQRPERFRHWLAATLLNLATAEFFVHHDERGGHGRGPRPRP